ncbi:hypothetical protein ACNOYE_09370 [Nannocystaceae bacterium ST9]
MNLPLLLALAEEEEVPNFAAVALSPVVGWLFFAALLGLVAFFLAHRESWRRLFLRVDDPRPMAAMRIVFGLCALSNVNELSDQFIYLFTDEGIFPTDVAQHFRARQQFAGFGDGTAETEPWGFFSFGAMLEWLKGPNWSLLLFDSSPKFFWCYLIVLEVVMLAFIVGFQTKWIKWLAWFLYMGLILRNTLFWEATENVYRVFFFYLILSRCGEAWSVDNWLRCRKLRKQGKLSLPDSPGKGAGCPASEGQPALEPIYRAIPAWPRMLVILNVAALYCATGTLKNGPIWSKGDAMYYAFNLDHFYRLPPQVLSSVFGTTLFKLNTHVTHWWEILFPVVVFGLVVRWHRREQIPRLTGWPLWQARLGLAGFCTAFYALVLYSYPVHYEATEEGFSLLGLAHFAPEDSLRAVMWTVAISAPLFSVAMVLAYRWLRDRPARAERKHLRWLDLDWVCRWPFGRRIWLVLGLVFHGHLILTMNIGWFSPGLLACYFAFMNGGELSHILAAIGRAANRWLRIPMPAHVRNYAPAPVADPRISGVRDHVPAGLPANQFQLGLAELLTAIALIVVGVVRRVQTDPDLWEEMGKVVSKAKVDLPAGLLAEPKLIEVNWFIAMVAVMALIVVVRRMRGFGFNAWFGPVIVLAGWIGSVLAEHGYAAMIWVVVAVGVLTWLATRKKAEPGTSTAAREDRPWAYGPIGRTLATLVTLYQITAVASTQIPDKDSWSTFHKGVDDTFKLWLSTTQTSQGWGMFAPNPPRRNVFMRVMVTDTDGEVYDLNTDVYACFMPDATAEVCDDVYPMPWIWYSRRGKMNRRIAGSEGGAGGWYQKWHARYICREWQREHGHLPEKVELYKIGYPIPTPEQVKGKPYDPKTQYNKRGSTTKIHTTECAGSPLGQLSDVVRERYGLDPTPAGEEFVPWNKNRCRTWEQKLIDDDRKKYGQVDVTDPKYDVCPDTPAVVRKALDEQNQQDEETVEDAPLSD